MNEVLIRFPVAGLKIFKQLDDKSLIKSKGINKIVQTFLDNCSLIWRRRIMKYLIGPVKFKPAWSLVMRKVSNKKSKEIALAIEEFYVKYKFEPGRPCAPHTIALYLGNVNLYKYFANKTGMQNLAMNDG